MSMMHAVEGIEPLMNVLRKLPTNVAGKLVKPAMREAGKLLQGQLRSNAIKQLAGATSRGYKRKSGKHLSASTGTRAKMYRKGTSVFVAVGFAYKEGGYHGHLVELGHQNVKGGTLSVQGRKAGVTAAGNRWLAQHGLEKALMPKFVLRGKNKGKLRKDKGVAGYQYVGQKAWLGMAPGKFYKVGDRVFGRKIRGGGKASGGRTRAYPMLGPAFQTMARPMLITVENELKKIEAEAVRLAGNIKPGTVTWGSGKSSAR